MEIKDYKNYDIPFSNISEMKRLICYNYDGDSKFCDDQNNCDCCIINQSDEMILEWLNNIKE